MPANLANFGAFAFWCSDALTAVTFRNASRGAFRVSGRFHLLRGCETTEFGPSNPTTNTAWSPPSLTGTNPSQVVGLTQDLWTLTVISILDLDKLVGLY